MLFVDATEKVIFRCVRDFHVVEFSDGQRLGFVNEDGIIDISIIDKIPIDHLGITMPLALANHLQLSQHVEMFRCSEVIIDGNEDRWVDIDGEGINLGRTISFVNNPRSVKVYGRNMKELLIVRT